MSHVSTHVITRQTTHAVPATASRGCFVTNAIKFANLDATDIKEGGGAGWWASVSVNIADGPSFAPPSVSMVQCTPRKGADKSGTGYSSRFGEKPLTLKYMPRKGSSRNLAPNPDDLASASAPVPAQLKTCLQGKSVPSSKRATTSPLPPSELWPAAEERVQLMTLRDVMICSRSPAIFTVERRRARK